MYIWRMKEYISSENICYICNPPRGFDFYLRLMGGTTLVMGWDGQFWTWGGQVLMGEEMDLEGVDGGVPPHIG